MGRFGHQGHQPTTGDASRRQPIGPWYQEGTIAWYEAIIAWCDPTMQPQVAYDSLDREGQVPHRLAQLPLRLNHTRVGIVNSRCG